MGGGVGSVRVGRAVGGELALGTVATSRSEGVGERKRPTAARLLVSGTAAESPLFVVLQESGAAGATGMAIL